MKQNNLLRMHMKSEHCYLRQMGFRNSGKGKAEGASSGWEGEGIEEEGGGLNFSVLDMFFRQCNKHSTLSMCFQIDIPSLVFSHGQIYDAIHSV